MSYQIELETALAAVRAASRVCRAVQADLVNAGQLSKGDKSPVTVADYASQAVVCHHLQRAFPDDGVVGEENADALRDPAQAELLQAVTKHARGELGRVDPDAVLHAIDRGTTSEGGAGRRFWTLDPIDGTKGFLAQRAIRRGTRADRGWEGGARRAGVPESGTG